MSSLAGALGASTPVLPRQHMSLAFLTNAAAQPPLADRPSYFSASPVNNDVTGTMGSVSEAPSADATIAPREAQNAVIQLEEMPPPPVRRAPTVPPVGAWSAAASDVLEPSSAFALPDEEDLGDDMDPREAGSHAARHASNPVLPSRKTKKAKKQPTSTQIGDQALLDKSQIWSEHQHAIKAANEIRDRLELDIMTAALQLRVRPEKIRKLVMGSTFCKTLRRPNLWNAKQKWVSENSTAGMSSFINMNGE